MQNAPHLFRVAVMPSPLRMGRGNATSPHSFCALNAYLFTAGRPTERGLRYVTDDEEAVAASRLCTWAELFGDFPILAFAFARSGAFASDEFQFPRFRLTGRGTGTHSGLLAMCSSIELV